MATNYTTLLGFALPTTGELPGTWGTTVNDSVTELVEDAIAATATASVAAADWTLSVTGSGSANEARCAILVPTGSPGVSRNIIAPKKSKAYVVINQSNGAVVVKGSDTTGATIAAGEKAVVAWNGADFVVIAGASTGAVTSVAASSPLNSSGGTTPTISLTGQVAVANGGTGAGSFTNGGIIRGNGTAALSVASAADIVSAIGATAVKNATNATTATNATNATNATTSTNIAGGAANRIPYNTGSGSTSFITAPVTSSTFLRWNGASFDWAAAGGGGGVTSVSTSTPTTIGVSGTTTVDITLNGTNVTNALGYTPYNGSTNPNNYVTSSSLSGYAQLSGSNTWTSSNTFSAGATSQAWNMSSATSMFGASPAGGQYFAIRFDINGSTIFQLIPGGNYSYTNFYPSADNSYSLGASGTRWNAVWATNPTIQTSDQRLKTNITNSQLGLSFINRLRPVSYKWIVGEQVEDGYVDEETTDENGNVIRTSKVPKYKTRPGVRTHYGFLSQEVKSAIDQENVGDFAGWLLTDKEDPDSEQCLRLGEFISPMVKAIQELSAKVQTLEAEVAALKGN